MKQQNLFDPISKTKLSLIPREDLEKLFQYYNNLYGVDYSQVMIAAAKKNLSQNVKLHVAKANILPFEDNFFDAVLLFAVLNCIPNSKEEVEIISEGLRVLKKGGYLLINDFVMSDSLGKYETKSDQYGEFGLFQIEKKCNMRHTTPKRIKNMVPNSTLFFESVNTETSMNGNPITISSQIFKLLT